MTADAPEESATGNRVLGGRTLRSKSQARSAVLIGGGATIVMVALGLTAHAAAARAFAVLFATVLAVATVRAMGAGVRIEDDHVCVRGLFRTRRLLWADIERFSFGQLGVFPAVGIAQRKDDRAIAMTSIAVGRMASPRARREAEALISDLNDALSQQRRLNIR